MAKHVSRLSDFEIPRAEGASSEGAVLKGDPEPLDPANPAEVPSQSPLPHQKGAEAAAREQTSEYTAFPTRIVPRPVAEPRQAITVRLPVSMHERIRTLMFTSRRSQQDIVEDALNTILTANGT